MKSWKFIHKVLIEGSVSQIFLFRPSFSFYVKKRVIFYQFFFIFYVLFLLNTNKKDINILSYSSLH